ncbi:KH domain-containing protein [Candidatus Saccharibacteria bacterium]|nr:KH domain-containing protein [Candidatus Saccharibacteria bacterium]
MDQQFIEYIIKSLVSNPDAVKVERRIDEKGVLLELTVDPEDLGRVIGKRGATAQSLRTLLRALGTKNDARYNLKIVDTGYPSRDNEGGGSDDVASTGHSSATAADDTQAPTQDDDTSTPLGGTDESTSVSTTRDDLDELRDEDDVALPQSSESSRHSDVLSQTRKELAELDDLDV